MNPDAFWLCVCGDYTDNCHCPTCLAEAPWGCDCGIQDDDYESDMSIDYQLDRQEEL